jgi:hypothetical protein
MEEGEKPGRGIGPRSDENEWNQKAAWIVKVTLRP